MASGYSNYAKNVGLPAFFGLDISADMPAQFYAALFTTTNDPDPPTGELTVDGYARLPISFITSGPATDSSRTIFNDGAITWTALGACTIQAIAFYDDISAGNLWYWADFSEVTVADGDDVNLDDEELQVGHD